MGNTRYDFIYNTVSSLANGITIQSNMLKKTSEGRSDVMHLLFQGEKGFNLGLNHLATTVNQIFIELRNEYNAGILVKEEYRKYLQPIEGLLRDYDVTNQPTLNDAEIQMEIKKVFN